MKEYNSKGGTGCRVGKEFAGQENTSRQQGYRSAMEDYLWSLGDIAINKLGIYFFWQDGPPPTTVFILLTSCYFYYIVPFIIKMGKAKYH